MPHRTFTVDEVAAYLHLGRADVERLARDGEIPVENRGGRLVFRRKEVDAWASQRILGFAPERLDEYHRKTSADTREYFETEIIMPGMITPGHIEPRLSARTKASVLRAMAALAEKTGHVTDAKGLLESLEAREVLCSTALPEGLALLHPRHHDPYMFDASFVVLGRPVQEIHFSAPDGLPTTLFFLICCQDDRIHLHTLARLCLMAQKTALLGQLRQAPDGAAMLDCILAAERQVLESRHFRAR